MIQTAVSISISQDLPLMSRCPHSALGKSRSTRNKATHCINASEEGKLDVVMSLMAKWQMSTNGMQFTRLVSRVIRELKARKVLIDVGADVNSRDKFGWTPLHGASRFQHLDVVRLLLT